MNGMGKSKLSHEDVLEIRQRLESGESNKSIALSYNVTVFTIGDIKRGKRPVDQAALNAQHGVEFNIGGEQARLVSGFDSVAVTSKGNVYSRKTGVWKPISSVVFNGYRRVWLENGITRRNAGVHRLVLEEFVGPCPDGMEACHGDGNPLNNDLSNLRWDTYKSNANDRRKHGTLLMGEKVGNSKLKSEQVKEILSTPRTVSSVKLAPKYNVNPRHIRRIRQGVRWKHMTVGASS